MHHISSTYLVQTSCDYTTNSQGKTHNKKRRIVSEYFSSVCQSSSRQYPHNNYTFLPRIPSLLCSSLIYYALGRILVQFPVELTVFICFPRVAKKYNAKARLRGYQTFFKENAHILHNILYFVLQQALSFRKLHHLCRQGVALIYNPHVRWQDMLSYREKCQHRSRHQRRRKEPRVEPKGGEKAALSPQI